MSRSPENKTITTVKQATITATQKLSDTHHLRLFGLPQFTNSTLERFSALDRTGAHAVKVRSPQLTTSQLQNVMRLDFSYTSDQLDNRSITAHFGGEAVKRFTR
jgi:hypothetical protein